MGDFCWWGVWEIVMVYCMGNIMLLEFVDVLIVWIDWFDFGFYVFIYFDLEGVCVVVVDFVLLKGLLYGIFIGIKDVIDVKGMVMICYL